MFRHSDCSRSGFGMETIFAIHPRSRSLPEIVSKNGQPRPDSCSCRALCQHPTQTKLAFKHTDGRFYAAAKPLQLPKPLLSLMRFFCSAQAPHLWDANFLNTSLAKLHHVIGTVVASIGSDLLWLYAEAGFCLSHHRKQLCAIAGIAPVNLIVNDDSGTILHQLQRAPKLHRLIKFSFADRWRFRVVKRDNSLRDRFLSLKLLLGLVENSLCQFNLLQKLLFELWPADSLPYPAAIGKCCDPLRRSVWQVWPLA